MEERGLKKKETVKYYSDREDIYSDIYYIEDRDTAIIVDHNITELDFTKYFSYREYTNTQNHLMKKYRWVYRFLSERFDREKVARIIDQGFEIPLNSKRNIQRYGESASYLEHHFEKMFFELYGEDAYPLLAKEKWFAGFNGENIFADYVIETSKDMIAIEENGENYHHPQKIGLERYYKQLEKQNALVYQGYKVYRFSKNEIEFKDRMVEEMEVYFGDKKDFISQQNISKARAFKLYEHQEITLKDLTKMRQEGIESCVVVLPTGTGKTTVALEDMRSVLKRFPQGKGLVLVPSDALKKQWKNQVSDILVMTYSKMMRDKNRFSQEEFKYIVVDEAHHSTAPGLAKVLNYFSPNFLLGITATPERLDNKKLEEIYSKVETKLTLKEAIEKEICCPIRVFRLESNIDLSEVRFNGKEYIAGDLEKRVEVSSRNELIADTVDKYFGSEVGGMREKQGIIFCINIKHAEKMAHLLNDRGISAKAVSGKDKKSKEYIEEYLTGKIRFLCSCQLISEGWDAPNTSIIVMARPTMSKVLYYQQLGRGTRKAPEKECLYVIDVVDNYSFNIVPWSTNAIFGVRQYTDFMNISTGKMDKCGEMIYIDHLLEKEKNLQEINIETFENIYGDMISTEEIARALFLSTSTINAWIKKKEVEPDASFSLGSTIVYKFRKERIEEIREKKNLKKRDETTILEDFWEFIQEKDYTFSYKIIFILSLLKHLKKDGEADFEEVKRDYIGYYNNRIMLGLPVDRKKCPYTEEYLNRDKDMIRSILNNPFEKFERKRFIYYGKDIKNIGFSFYLWEKMTSDDLKRLKQVMLQDLEAYYRDLGGIGDINIFN